MNSADNRFSAELAELAKMPGRTPPPPYYRRRGGVVPAGARTSPAAENEEGANQGASWLRASRGWRCICALRARAHAGALPARMAALYTPDWRRRRVEALVLAGFRCERCAALVDPDRPFGVVHHDGDPITPDTHAADLRPVCGPCRLASWQTTEEGEA